MAQKIRKQNKREVEVSLGTVIDGFMKGIGGLLGLTAKLEKEGKDEYAEQGEIKGKTESGKEYRGAYGFRVKIGLNPEDFSARPACRQTGTNQPQTEREGKNYPMAKNKI